MAVVINDFEVITEPAVAVPPAEALASTPMDQPSVEEEVERVLRLEYERACRVWAH